MILRISEIRLPIDHGPEDLEKKILKTLKVKKKGLIRFKIHRKSIDARKRDAILYLYTIDAEVKNPLGPLKNVTRAPEGTYRFAPVKNKDKINKDKNRRRPVIVGTGPCGLFAGLILAQAGLRPILLERGKAAKDRLKDVELFWKTGKLSPQSNVQFGEGGAGTFSDGKLTTRIKDPYFRLRKVFEELVAAGAPEDILFNNKPHIGTDKLIDVVGNIRKTICSLGGEVRFESRVNDLSIKEGAVQGVVLAGGERIAADTVVMAIGHSARDTFEMLFERGIHLEGKSFSIGLRIEHPQELIDRSQYGRFAGHPKLGPADYRLVHHCSNNRSVYTFCMCPGGRVIAASSEEGGVVVNGMSLYARDSASANSGLLVGIQPLDFGGGKPLAGVAFQRVWERKAFELGGGGFKAPAQLVDDFLKGQPSSPDGTSLSVEPSYKPGVTFCDLSPCLPHYAVSAFKEAILAFDQKLKGFAMPNALLTGVETRSSSPVRIVRSKTFESISLKGLYPSGEGAGYAGGIISSAVDGIKVAEAIIGSY